MAECGGWRHLLSTSGEPARAVERTSAAVIMVDDSSAASGGGAMSAAYAAEEPPLHEPGRRPAGDFTANSISA
jgi:hypothetical protein